MNLISVARRAKLGYKTRKGYEQAIDKLRVAKEYNNKVSIFLRGDKGHSKFHNANYLIGLLSIMEAYMSDMLLEYIVCYPGHSNEKTIRFDSISKAGSIAEIAKNAAEKRVNELTYKKFIEYHEEFSSIIGLENHIESELLGKIAEIKATRDIFVHANGRCNEIYIQKSGARARAHIGEELPLLDEYISISEKAIEEYISGLYNEIPERIKTFGRANAFKEMWDCCELSRVKNFDEAWDLELDSDMVKPKDSVFDYGWSGSEQAAFDFFLGVYSMDHPKRRTDLMAAMNRWPPNTGVGKVMISWMESPFWF